jgi:integrase
MAERRVDMTDLWVRNVRTTKDREEWRDTHQQNLELRVTRNGVKTWRLHYTRGDRLRKAITLGRYAIAGAIGLSLGEARQRARAMTVNVDQGGDPAGSTRLRREAPTFAEVTEEWLANRMLDPNHNPHSLNDDRGMIRRHINPVLGHFKIQDIRKADLLHLIRVVRSKSHARKYKDGKPRALTVRINRIYERARAIMRWALAEDIIHADPCGGIKKPVPIEPSRNIVLSDLQLRSFWSRVDNAPMEPGTRIALKLSLLTGQRIGAVASIRKEDMHLLDERPHWIIPRLRKGRSRKVRRLCVPLTPLAIECVESALSISGESAFLFPTTSKSGALTTSGVEVAWSRSRPKMGLTGINIHDLRRTASERMKRLGHRNVVGLVLGHAPRGVTDIHYDTDDIWAYETEKRAALEAWSNYLEQTIALDDRQLSLDFIRPAA